MSKRQSTFLCGWEGAGVLPGACQGETTGGKRRKEEKDEEEEEEEEDKTTRMLMA